MSARWPVLILASLLAGVPVFADDVANVLSDAERAEGWRLLFDGESFAGWHNYGDASGQVDGWRISDGVLAMTRETSAWGLVWNAINPFAKTTVDLMSTERFERFELSVDWKISPSGNSGIFYLVPDDEAFAWWKLGLEMQVLDDTGHEDGALERHRCGDLYDLVASSSRPARPVGEWNTARIVVDGDHIEHWLNGVQVVDFERSGPQWEALVAGSKFADRPGYGTARRGHILLQDHGDRVWYRNIKIRELR